ncbi:caspase family protein [Streptomyces zagrosensis]|uniref:Peptidase C14 caspase domain-containing protein n=1 Tax=Streptomyces zagrosensis TaxID=1042984 RepID=A0A7W9V0S9_9ACTN|nr:caspase family protein [Streptomyces zagrosensis]MBB5937561.1 hypothetical protein [Streptomyces zagrosensis]
MTESGKAYRALLIGNSAFPRDPDRLRTLLGPPTDVPLLAAALTDPETGLHEADAVGTVLEQTAQHIRDELEEFFGRALPHEQLFLYYSGHGLLDLRNRLRLCARDTTVGRLQARSVDLEFINALIDGCAARSIVVILDCCFSGAAAVKGTDPAAQLAGHGRFVMTSSSSADTSADAERAGAASPFTRHLVTGLRTGASGRDDLVTAYDVFQYVHRRLLASGQTPHMKTEAAVGAIPLARRPQRPAEREGAAGPGRTAGGDALSLDVRPVFTDPNGTRAPLATYTDSSGLLLVRLPQHGAFLTTHREEITAAADGAPATAELYNRAAVTWRAVHPRETGRKVTDLRADTSGGTVAFILPDDAGTVEWQEWQVRAFHQARSQRRWPGTLHAPNSTIEEYKTDRVYRRLRTATWRARLWLSTLVSMATVLVSMVTVLDAPTGDTWYERGCRVVLGLAFLLSLCQTLLHIQDTRRFRRVRRVLYGSGLYAVSMVMETGFVTETSSDGFGVIELQKPFAWLRYDGAPEASFTRGEPDGMPLEEERSMLPALAVPLHSFHGRYVRERCDRPDKPGLERVEVIGTPRPGHWVVICTEDGLLWPHAEIW